MLVVLLNVVNDSPSNLNACEKVKISQNKENLAVLIKVGSHVVLENEEIVFSVVTTGPNQIIRVRNLVLLVVVSISQWKYVVAQLKHHHREVDLG